MSENTIKALVIAEHDNDSLSIDTLRTIQAATTLPNVEITLLIMGHQCQSVAEAAAKISPLSSIKVADHDTFEHILAESASELVAEVGTEYSHILAPATTFGKNILPRVAALLDVGQLSDVIELESEDTFIRPIYAGNAIAKVKSNDNKKLMTIRTSAFDSVEVGQDSTTSITPLTNTYQNQASEFVSVEKTKSERPELPAARVVVSGGRGLGSKENFELVEKLADKLNGAIGASRAAVDAGYVSNDLQVGQTGKIVAPELYIAVGISGAIQHLAGMKESKVIVAINSDPEAPIFQIADYGLVGDLFEIMPELVEAI
ncbi:FAD-binding protein [Vibrio sp. S4M6]|uniref:electron transfer flavoprotein subunit alpha/FixB family protein n=1 Tax=Vibrio sinus TaxID=2946865 RepID=UPI002029C27B|nr:FAD-binding protein [Vibrio sinus]MCL9781954.1 FAD-binding protein [Vibrio sinus]